MSATTNPASFIPSIGNSRPHWLNVTLAYLDIQLTEPAIEVFIRPRRLVIT
jgi:hypothetical protein